MTVPPPLPGSRPPPASPPPEPPPLPELGELRLEEPIPPRAPQQSRRLPPRASKQARGRNRIQATGDDPTTMDLLEQAFHLLRSTPRRAWGEWLLGAIPWYAALVWLICHLSWFRASAGELWVIAIALAPLFLLLRVTQARFCGHVCALLDPSAGPASPRRILADAVVVAGPLAGLQLASLPVLLPFPAITSYAHHRLLLVGRRDGPEAPAQRHAIALAEAGRWAFTVAWAWACLFCFGVILMFTVYVTVEAFGQLRSILLGLPPFFDHSFHGSTVRGVSKTLYWLSGTAALALLDPWWKAFMVAIHHQGRGRTSGSDLRAELAQIRLQSARRARPVAGAAGLLVATFLLLATPAPAQAGTGGATAEPAPVRLQAESWEASAREVFAKEAYRWRLPPPSVTGGDQRDPHLLQWIADLRQTLLKHWRRLRETLSEWWNRLFPHDPRWAPADSEPRDRTSALPWILGYTLGLAALLGLLLLWRAHRRRPPEPAAASLAAAAPDLHATEIDPGSRPWQEWLRLARTEAAAGHWRLALRALFLARLARLGDDGLLTLTLAKTNRAYEHELTRRAGPDDPRPVAFAGQRRLFEAVWYGRLEVGPPVVHEWLQELEQEAPPS